MNIYEILWKTCEVPGALIRPSPSASPLRIDDFGLGGNMIVRADDGKIWEPSVFHLMGDYWEAYDSETVSECTRRMLRDERNEVRRKHAAVLAVAEMICKSLLTCAGQVITEDVARERANNTATAISEYIQPRPEDE
jgi:hypothetical protein